MDTNKTDACVIDDKMPCDKLHLSGTEEQLTY